MNRVFLNRVFVKCILTKCVLTKCILRTAAFCLLGCLVSSGVMWATPPRCKQATLAHYISLGAEGCEFGKVVFANFKYSASAKGGAEIIKADQITVNPILIPTATPSFEFSAPWSVANAELQDSVIKYSATLPAGDSEAATLTLVLGQAQVGTIGSVAVEESTNVGKLQVFDRCSDDCQTKPEDNFQFNPVSVVLFTIHVSLNGGSGGASLQDFESQLNLCPPCA